MASRLLFSWAMAPGSTHTVGELCVGGDWACSNGDLETLRHIATRLAAYADEQLRCELATLVELCRCDPDRAVAAWLRLRPRVIHDGDRPMPPP